MTTQDCTPGAHGGYAYFTLDCIDATIKAGFEHGFKMIVPSNTNSTFDNKYMTAEQTYKYYNEFMWNRRYAECISFEKALELMD